MVTRHGSWTSQMRDSVALICFATTAYVPSHVRANEDTLDLELLRDLYVQSTSAVTNIEAEFERESVKPERRFLGKGRWLRDRDRILEAQVFEDHGIRSFDSFDGIYSYHANYEKEDGAWELRFIRKTRGRRTDIGQSPSIDSFLWLKRDVFGGPLSELLGSEQARIHTQQGHPGARVVVVDLGTVLQKKMGGVTLHAEVTLAEQYGWLPVTIRKWAVGESQQDVLYRKELWGADGWSSECKEWTLIAHGVWLPKLMRIRHGADRDHGWDLKITNVKVNLDPRSLSFLPPAPEIGTSLIDETIPGKPVVKIHRESEAVVKAANDFAAQIQLEHKNTAGQKLAVAHTGTPTSWRWPQGIALLILCFAGVLYYRRAR